MDPVFQFGAFPGNNLLKTHLGYNLNNTRAESILFELDVRHSTFCLVATQQMLFSCKIIFWGTIMKWLLFVFLDKVFKPLKCFQINLKFKIRHDYSTYLL